MLKFIDSNGGPLLMLEHDLLPFWGGTDNIGGLSTTHRNRGPFEGPSDYDRACEIRDWIAPVRVRDGTGLVFSGDDLGLGLARMNNATFLAVRIYYQIEDIDGHIEFAKEHPELFVKEFEVSISSNSATVFDSAFPGVEVGPQHLKIDILPGIYEVLTYEHKAQNAETIFHKFHWCRGV
jgi:hypothetical protein